MALFTDSIIRGLLKKSLETAQIDDEGWKDVRSGKLIEVPAATKIGAPQV